MSPLPLGPARPENLRMADRSVRGGARLVPTDAEDDDDVPLLPARPKQDERVALWQIAYPTAIRLFGWVGGGGALRSV